MNNAALAVSMDWGEIGHAFLRVISPDIRRYLPAAFLA
jgi:hypothetical protein